MSLFSYGDPTPLPDDYTGPIRMDSRAGRPFAAYVNGEILRGKNGVGRCFKTWQAAQRAVEAAAPCRLCAAGFPLVDGTHVPTQRLGMIPITPCRRVADTLRRR